MSGAVDWNQLIFIVMLLLGAGGGVFAFLEWDRRRRHEMRSHYDQRLVVIEEQFQEKEDALERRVEQLEHFNTALNVVLKQLDQFQEKVDERFDKLEEKRSDDMGGLHRRLDALMHEKIDRKNDAILRGK